MDVIDGICDVDRIADELCNEQLTRIKDGSGSSHFDGPENWILGLSMARIQVTDRERYRYTRWELDTLQNRFYGQYGSIVQIMVNQLDAGGKLWPHKDGLPNRARFHLPVITNDDVFWWDEINGGLHMQKGKWYGPVPYCGILHSVTNAGREARIHLVVDFERGT